jgi:hypothetical protein
MLVRLTVKLAEMVNGVDLSPYEKATSLSYPSAIATCSSQSAGPSPCLQQFNHGVPGARTPAQSQPSTSATVHVDDPIFAIWLVCR